MKFNGTCHYSAVTGHKYGNCATSKSGPVNSRRNISIATCHKCKQKCWHYTNMSQQTKPYTFAISNVCWLESVLSMTSQIVMHMDLITSLMTGDWTLEAPDNEGGTSMKNYWRYWKYVLHNKTKTMSPACPRCSVRMRQRQIWCSWQRQKMRSWCPERSEDGFADYENGSDQGYQLNAVCGSLYENDVNNLMYALTQLIWTLSLSRLLSCPLFLKQL